MACPARPTPPDR